jgi:hypothetical protein
VGESAAGKRGTEKKVEKPVGSVFASVPPLSWAEKGGKRHTTAYSHTGHPLVIIIIIVIMMMIMTMMARLFHLRKLTPTT